MSEGAEMAGAEAGAGTPGAGGALGADGAPGAEAGAGTPGAGGALGADGAPGAEAGAAVPAARGAPAAFFDLDRTLMSGSSGFHFARAAFETGLISRGQLVRDGFENLRFRLVGSTDERADAVRERVGTMIAGIPVRELQRLAPRVLAGVLPRLYPRMLERAWGHQDAGLRVYICTAASQEMAELMAYVLGFDGGVGSRSEIVDGRYTGREAGPFAYREGKAQAMRELAAREGISLADSFAYSDSESDMPMLRAVGHPVVVNPDPHLARIAREQEWEVVTLDRLGRRLKIGAAVGAAALSLGAGVALGGLPRRARGR